MPALDRHSSSHERTTHVRKSPSLVLRLCTTFALLVTGCDKLINEATAPPIYLGNLDRSQSWSNDARHIVFQRNSVSTYGPPGLYLIASSGGTARFIRGGDFIWPEYPALSNTDEYLFFIDQFRLKVIDLKSGQEKDLSPPTGLVRSLSASPVGPQVVYALTGALRIHDLTADSSTALVHEGQPIAGVEPKWSPNGDRIAAFAGAYRSILLLFSPDGAICDTILNLGPETSIDEIRWYRNRGSEPFLFVALVGALTGTYAVKSDGTWLGKANLALGPYDAFSSDGQFEIINAVERSGYGVLYIHDMQDHLGIGDKQLTAP